MVCLSALLLHCFCLFRHFGERDIDTTLLETHGALTKNDNKVNKTWCSVTEHLFWWHEEVVEVHHCFKVRTRQSLGLGTRSCVDGQVTTNSKCITRTTVIWWLLSLSSFVNLFSDSVSWYGPSSLLTESILGENHTEKRNITFCLTSICVPCGKSQTKTASKFHSLVNLTLYLLFYSLTFCSFTEECSSALMSCLLTTFTFTLRAFCSH